MFLSKRLRAFWRWMTRDESKPFRKAHLQLEALEDRRLPAVIPTLHSILPENHTPKTATLYLDFDGRTRFQWATVGEAGLWAETPPFDLDGNHDVLSQVEADAISEICARVAED